MQSRGAGLLLRVQTDLEDRRRHVFRSAEGAVDQDLQVRGDQVHEEPLRLDRTGAP